MRNIHKYLLVILVIHGFIYPLTAQSTINSTEFIQQYISVVNSDNNGTPLTDNFKAAWLDELEFRTRTRDFDINQQRYTLRFKPSTKKIRDAQTNLSNLLEKEFLVKKAALGNSLLVLAYKDWLELVRLKKKIAIQENLLVIYGDIEKVLLKLSQYQKLNVKDFLAVKRSITSATIDIQSSKKSIADYLTDTAVNDLDLLSIEDIRSNLVEINLSNQSSISNQQELIKQAVLDAEMELEIAEQQRLLDFFQVQYDGPHTDGLQERVSIGASINIPISSKRSLKMQELELEQLLLSEETRVDHILQRDKANRRKIKLERLLDHYELTQAQLRVQQEEAFKILSKMTQEEGVTPLLLLYHKVEEEKQALDLLKIESDIYDAYMDYLDDSEQLYVVPFRNFLVAND